MIHRSSIGSLRPRFLSSWCAVLVGVMGWYTVAGYANGRYVFWRQLEGDVAAVALVSGSLIVACVALEWQLVWKRSLQFVPSSAIRDRGPIVARWLKIASLSAVLWLLGMSIGVLTSGPTIVGAPNVSFILATVASAFAFTALGLVSGHLLPLWYGPILAMGLTYTGLAVSMYFVPHLKPFVPLADGVPPFGQAYTSSFALLQAAWFLLVGGLLITLVGRSRTVGSRSSLVAGVAVVSLIGMLLGSTDATSSEPVEFGCSVKSEESVRVCAERTLLQASSEIPGALARANRLLPTPIERLVVDDQPSEFDPNTGVLMLNVGSYQSDPVGSAVFMVIASPDTIARECRNAITMQLAAEAVSFLAENRNRPASPAAIRIAEALDDDPDWLSQNHQRIEDCAIAPAELPGMA